MPGLRPTPARIRETLFNWLAPRLAGARCLDLFAGSGALGLEALSRGAGATTFVESSRRAADVLRQALDVLGAEEATVQVADAYAFLDTAPARAFDVVFLDPPYADESVDELCRLLAVGGWLSPGAVVYFEQGTWQAPPELPDGWRVTRDKTAGQVRYALAETDAAD